MKRLATLLGVLASFLGLLVFLISWEPECPSEISRFRYCGVRAVHPSRMVWTGGEDSLSSSLRKSSADLKRSAQPFF